MRLTALALFSLMILGPLNALAADVPNLVGQFGFDWLQPQKSRCTPITQTIQSKFKSCETFGKDSTQSFAGKGDFHKCRIDKNHEYMVYKTNPRCAEEFGIMDSNE